MSEDVGVKAPVTRLRRRLSIESDEVKSPASTTTPTKKKGGRLATKPQLDLIEEIDAEQVPKRSTRKTAAKDIIEPVEEKAVTPSRRSTRIRSNTSILSETSQAQNSPRAKRAAARRISQAGSDNDAPVTPARQTRRTRKDSTSSIDKQVEKTTEKISAPTDIIVEEKETNEDTNIKERSINESPKPKEKKGKISNTTKSPKNIDNLDDNHKEVKDNDLDKTNYKEIKIARESTESVHETLATDNNEENNIKDKAKKDDSIDNLIDNIKPKKSNSILHKSTSAIEDSKGFKSKRHRTKSGSAINSNDCSFFSDTEISKKKRKDKSFTHSNYVIGSDGDVSEIKNKLSPLCTTNGDNMPVNTVEENIAKILNKTKKSSKSEEPVTLNEDNITSSLSKSGWKKIMIDQIQTDDTESKVLNDYVSPIKCFEHAPSKDIQSVVFIEEDSDSNACNDNAGSAQNLHSEDQCVPVLKHNDSNKQLPHDNSYEPMDIDESIQQNSSINTSIKNTSKLSKKESEKDTSVSMDLSNYCNKLTSNKSKRKSSLSSFESHSEKSLGESKSTLIISQMKDTSCSDIDGKTPRINNKAQLSKSINIPNKIEIKDIDKKKLSLDYSTSTPLQQKSKRLLGVSIDTSLITPKNKDKTMNESIQKSKEHLENSKEPSGDGSDDDSNQSDESETEVTKTQNEIIDDEAEEASEDYESGDSQDEDEKQYEEENEIVEKGETLDTEEEFSDDTDYEKDSFVVSSDEEDDDLLSGSGDDLSLSDNELSMSAKSKRKYNERKIKEQKKASREMYEARHKLDDSTKKSKSKKINRQRLESSSDSDAEMKVQKKKNNRQRLDSSQDGSQTNDDGNESVTKDKKLNRLSASVSGDNVLNEAEITICSESKLEDNDPISVAIKYEPKTPQKGPNLSAVVINENIEQIDVNQNASVMRPNETSDPLEGTMFKTNEDSSSSDDNNEIMNNYNSILENLNKNPKDIKSHDISLNINKKQKKAKEPIVDQLNLTQTKSKKNKNKFVETEMESKMNSDIELKKTETEDNAPIDEDDEASDSIDMRLLFPEDSNDSEPTNIDTNKKVTMPNTNIDNNFIPLKKSEAKTNLLENMDTDVEVKEVSLLNESKKKKKDRISQNTQVDDKPDETGDVGEISFFIDTTGDRFDTEEPIHTSVNCSSKKKKKCITTVDEVTEFTIEIDETAGKKTPKKSLTTESQIESGIVAEEAAECLTKATPQSGKKKKKENKSLNNTAIEEIEEQNEIEEPADVLTKATPQSGKKNKENKSLNNTAIEELEGKNETAQNEPTVPLKTPQSGKKKNKSILSLNTPNSQEENEQGTLIDIKASSEKKKKKSKKSLTGIQNEPLIDETSDEPAEIKQQSNEKAKLNQPKVDTQEVPLDINNLDNDEAPLEISYKSAKKDNSILDSQLSENPAIESSLNTSKTTSAKKRKRSATTDEDIATENKENYKDEQSNESFAGSQNKKRKLNNNIEVNTQDKDSTKDSKDLTNAEASGPVKLKKHKHATKQENIPIIDDKEKTSRNKKRKERDDDDTTNVSKMFKQNSFNKAQVTRLPSHILNQLGDKPNKTISEAKRAKVIATTKFTVEDTKVRRNKPSNYLEESVYLNDDSLLEKKQKYSIKKPKVLPFIPTASTSENGFTTNFKINILPRETQFVAKATDIPNFKKDFLQQQKMKKFHTFEKYKNQRSVKLSKF